MSVSVNLISKKMFDEIKKACETGLRPNRGRLNKGHMPFWFERPIFNEVEPPQSVRVREYELKHK